MAIRSRSGHACVRYAVSVTVLLLSMPVGMAQNHAPSGGAATAPRIMVPSGTQDPNGAASRFMPLIPQVPSSAAPQPTFPDQPVPAQNQNFQQFEVGNGQFEIFRGSDRPETAPDTTDRFTGGRRIVPGDGSDRYRSVVVDSEPAKRVDLNPSQETLEIYRQFVPEIGDPEVPIKLLVGQPRILKFSSEATKPKLKLYIPDEDVVRWDILSETEVALVGLRPGNTVLTVWVNDPQADGGVRTLSYLVQVYEDPGEGDGAFERRIEFIPPGTQRSAIRPFDLQEEICEAFPDADIQLSMVADQLILRGQAKDSVEAEQIARLLERIVRSRNRDDMTQVILFRGDTTVLSEIRDAALVNLLEIPGEQQVNLRVTVAEINRSALRSIGADVQIGSGDVSFLSLVSDTGFAASAGEGNLLVDRPDFRLALNALRRLNLARTLAEPNLTALNGRTADFFVGDNVPLPNATAGFGGIGQSVAFVQVGVAINFTPFIVDRDRIRLQVAGQVSAIDADADQTNIGGSSVSTQNARSFQTTLDLRDGETMALGGLISHSFSASDARTPFLGDLPYVGTLFANKQATHSEQELVVLVTPELVRPLAAHELPPLPGSDVFEPTDAEFFLKNRLESRRRHDYRGSVRTDHARQRRGHDCHEDIFIIGDHGYGQPYCNKVANEPFYRERIVERTVVSDEALPPPVPDASDPQSDVAR